MLQIRTPLHTLPLLALSLSALSLWVSLHIRGGQNLKPLFVIRIARKICDKRKLKFFSSLILMDHASKATFAAFSYFGRCGTFPYLSIRIQQISLVCIVCYISVYSWRWKYQKLESNTRCVRMNGKKKSRQTSQFRVCFNLCWCVRVCVGESVSVVVYSMCSIICYRFWQSEFGNVVSAKMQQGIDNERARERKK